MIWRHLESPGPPKMDLKWSENLIFWRCIFDDDFYSIFHWFLDAQTPRIVAPVEAKRYFLQNRRFRLKLKKWPNFHLFWKPKSMKNRSKIATRNLFAFWDAFFSIFNNFCSILASKKGSKFRMFFVCFCEKCVLELTCHKWRLHAALGPHLGGILIDFNDFHICFQMLWDSFGIRLGYVWVWMFV